MLSFLFASSNYFFSMTWRSLLNRWQLRPKWIVLPRSGNSFLSSPKTFRFIYLASVSTFLQIIEYIFNFFFVRYFRMWITFYHLRWTAAQTARFRYISVKHRNLEIRLSKSFHVNLCGTQTIVFFPIYLPPYCLKLFSTGCLVPWQYPNYSRIEFAQLS